MPWTQFHPAFALPFFGLSKKPFVLASLVIGSMAPDIPYFVLLRFVSWWHTFPLLFLYGIPASLLLAYVWVKYIQTPFMEAVPFKWKKEVTYNGLNWRDLLFGGVMATVGILTHVGIDGFTHRDGYAVQYIPLLQAQLLLLGKSMFVWHWLQYTLSGVGLILLMGYIAIHSETKPLDHLALLFWLRAGVFAFVLAGVVGALRYPFEALTIPGVIIISSTLLGIGFAALTARQVSR